MDDCSFRRSEYQNCNLHSHPPYFRINKNAFTSLKFDLKKVIEIDDYGIFVLFEIKNEVCHSSTDFQILNPSEKVQTQIKQIVLNDFSSINQKPSSLKSNLFIQAGESSVEM